jgi:ubiquinone biosynthesis protein
MFGGAAEMIAQSSIDLLTNAVGNVGKLVLEIQRDSLAVAQDSKAFYASAKDSTMAVRDAWRAAPRVTRIVTTGLKIAAAYRIHGALAPHMAPEQRATKLAALHQKSAEQVYDLCVELRGAILKLGQFFSCRRDLLAPAWIEALSRLQDQVPPVSTQAIVERINNELGAPVEELFAEFDEVPMATASIAQVHRAVLLDGTPVVVKVQLPGVESLVESDLTAMSMMAGILGDLLPATDWQTISSELGRSIRLELDFKTEAQNLVDFGAFYVDDEKVIVPTVYPELSTERVLTLSRVEGQSLTEFLESASPDDIDSLFAILLQSYCGQVLQHGLLHSDPHPGNFMVCDGPKLAVLDFGNVQRFTASERKAYAGLVIAALSRDQNKLAALLSDMGFRTKSGDTGPLLEFAEMFLEAFSTDTTFDNLAMDPFAQLDRAMAIAKKNPVVQVPQNFVLLGRVFAALSGLMIKYQPRINLMRIVMPLLA